MLKLPSLFKMILPLAVRSFVVMEILSTSIGVDNRPVTVILPFAFFPFRHPSESIAKAAPFRSDVNLNDAGLLGDNLTLKRAGVDPAKLPLGNAMLKASKLV